MARSRSGSAADVPAGLVFGVAAWLIADEVMVPLLGLGEGARRQGAAEHGLALVAHLAFGSVTESTLAGLRSIAPQ